MLMDKGYYDYDYTEPERKVKAVLREKSKEEIGSMLARFGFNTKLRSKEPKPLTPEEMQQIAMSELENK